jgi:EpsD family peptidyl-prolyl cis-trans isomerase
MLERLIEQQLLVEKARQANVDREPDVMMAMEAAKRAVLANEWLKRAVADVSRPTDRDVDDYLLQHPEISSGRHMYSFRLAALDVPVTELPKLKELLARTKSLDEALNQLQSRNIHYVISQMSKGSEQLPTELIGNLIGLKDGETAAFPYRGGVGLVELQSAATEVIDDAQKRRIVESALILEWKNERAEATLSGLKANAKIQLYGDFQGYAAELLTGSVAAPAAENTGSPAGKTPN